MPTYVVEFVGGPFDGHRQRVSVPPDQLVPQASLPVSADVFHLFEGRIPTRSARISSFALYQQDRSEGTIRYRFVGSVPPSRAYGLA